MSSPSGAVGTPGAAECKPTVKVSPPSGCSQERQQCDKSQATRPDLAHAAAAADCNTQHVEEQTTPSLNVDTDVTPAAIRPLSDEAANSGRVTLKVDGDREQMEWETKEAARPASLLPANASVKVTQSRSVEANVIQEAGRPLTDKATTSGLVVTEVVKTNDDDLDSYTLARPTVATLVAARPRNSEAQSEPSESVVTWSRRTRRFLSQALWACWLAVVWLLTRAATPLSRWSKGHSVTSQPQQRMGSPP